MPEIEVSFKIDANGILSVSAMDLTTGASQRVTIEAYQPTIDPEVKRLIDEGTTRADEDREFLRKVEMRKHMERLHEEYDQFRRSRRGSSAMTWKGGIHECFFRFDAALAARLARFDATKRIRMILTDPMASVGREMDLGDQTLIYEARPPPATMGKKTSRSSGIRATTCDGRQTMGRAGRGGLSAS